MEEKILTVPTGNDTATAMAMMNNNTWMYLVMLALFGGGNWGNNNRGAAIDAQLSAMQAQINDNNNNQWAREAIQGNGFAISQLAQSLNVDYNAMQNAINGVVNAINAVGAQNGMGFAGVTNAINAVGAQNGMGFAGVTNAINLGNLNMIQQMKDCCCATQKQILEQGYQGRIETINQTNDLQTSIRVENGLARAEIAAFRQAWENARYQDVVAEKTRLQIELDLLRQSQGTAAMIAPMQAEMLKLETQMQSFFNTYGGSSKTTTQTAAAGQ